MFDLEVRDNRTRRSFTLVKPVRSFPAQPSAFLAESLVKGESNPLANYGATQGPEDCPTAHFPRGRQIGGKPDGAFAGGRGLELIGETPQVLAIGQRSLSGQLLLDVGVKKDKCAHFPMRRRETNSRIGPPRRAQ